MENGGSAKHDRSAHMRAHSHKLLTLGLFWWCVELHVWTSRSPSTPCRSPAPPTGCRARGGRAATQPRTRRGTLWDHSSEALSVGIQTVTSCTKTNALKYLSARGGLPVQEFQSCSTKTWRKDLNSSSGLWSVSVLKRLLEPQCEQQRRRAVRSKLCDGRQQFYCNWEQVTTY